MYRIRIDQQIPGYIPMYFHSFNDSGTVMTCGIGGAAEMTANQANEWLAKIRKQYKQRLRVFAESTN